MNNLKPRNKECMIHSRVAGALQSPKGIILNCKIP